MKESSQNGSSPRRLALYVRHGGVDAVIISGDGCRRLTADVDPAITAPEKILEEAVYINPGLLDDFSRTDIVADTRRFVFAPVGGESDDSVVARMVTDLWPDADADDARTEPCGPSATVTSIFDRPLSGFVSRTFPSATLHSRIASLVGFLSTLSRPVNRMKLYVHLGGTSKLDIIIFSADGLIMANSFDCTETVDALYFVMAAVKDSGFDALDDETIVCGDPERCEVLTAQLRTYLNSVMPLLLPAPENEMPTELLLFSKENQQ